MIAEIIGGLGILGTASGFILAYKARGESRDALKKANESAERSRLAEAGTEAARRRADDAESRALAASSEHKVAAATANSLRSELARERREKGDLLERLAKAGVPVGDLVVDAAIDSLYPNEDRDRGETGGDPGTGAGADRADVPGDTAATSDETTTQRLPR